MITTVSLNPSIDRTVYVDQFQAGGLNRVELSHSVAAGKGVNVALCAAALGVDTECIGFMHKEGAKMFEKRLMLNSTAYNFIWCEGSVRTNIKIVDRATGAVTEINEPGDHISEDELRKMTELVSLHAENTDLLILSGSTPPGCPEDFYGTLIRNVEGLGCRCIVDADGERLKHAIDAKPYLVKPNRHEMEVLSGKTLTTVKEVRNAAFSLIDKGIEVVCVSLGDAGAVITNGPETFYAPKMEIDAKTTVGAGDAMVAGLACGFIGECDLEETMRMGVAAATARCMTEVHKVFDKAVYRSLLDDVRIESL